MDGSAVDFTVRNDCVALENVKIRIREKEVLASITEILDTSYLLSKKLTDTCRLYTYGAAKKEVAWGSVADFTARRLGNLRRAIADGTWELF